MHLAPDAVSTVQQVQEQADQSHLETAQDAASHLDELLIVPKDLLASAVVLSAEVTSPVLVHKCIVLRITCSTQTVCILDSGLPRWGSSEAAGVDAACCLLVCAQCACAVRGLGLQASYRPVVLSVSPMNNPAGCDVAFDMQQ